MGPVWLAAVWIVEGLVRACLEEKTEHARVRGPGSQRTGGVVGSRAAQCPQESRDGQRAVETDLTSSAAVKLYLQSNLVDP